MNGRKPSLAIKEHFWLFAILFLLSINFSRETAYARKNKTSIWNEVDLSCGKEHSSKDYKIFQTCKVNAVKGFDAKVYIQRNRDKKPLLVYSHERAVSAIVGHKLKLILFNDCPGVRNCQVMAAKIDSGKSWNIDTIVSKKYEKEIGHDHRLNILPFGRAFSPWDKKVLIEMELVYIFTTGAYEAEQVAKLYKKWWFIVDPLTGRILHVYRSAKIPRRWWDF